MVQLLSITLISWILTTFFVLYYMLSSIDDLMNKINEHPDLKIISFIVFGLWIWSNCLGCPKLAYIIILVLFILDLSYFSLQINDNLDIFYMNPISCFAFILAGIGNCSIILPLCG